VERPNDGYNARDFAVSRKTAAKIRAVRDIIGGVFALRAKLRMHVVEAMRLMLRNCVAMCAARSATRDA
jgi:hypothetical protein